MPSKAIQHVDSLIDIFSKQSYKNVTLSGTSQANRLLTQETDKYILSQMQYLKDNNFTKDSLHQVLKSLDEHNPKDDDIVERIFHYHYYSTLDAKLLEFSDQYFKTLFEEIEDYTHELRILPYIVDEDEEGTISSLPSDCTHYTGEFSTTESAVSSVSSEYVKKDFSRDLFAKLWPKQSVCITTTTTPLPKRVSLVSNLKTKNAHKSNSKDTNKNVFALNKPTGVSTSVTESPKTKNAFTLNNPNLKETTTSNKKVSNPKDVSTSKLIFNKYPSFDSIPRTKKNLSTLTIKQLKDYFNHYNFSLSGKTKSVLIDKALKVFNGFSPHAKKRFSVPIEFIKTTYTTDYLSNLSKESLLSVCSRLNLSPKSKNLKISKLTSLILSSVS